MDSLSLIIISNNTSHDSNDIWNVWHGKNGKAKYPPCKLSKIILGELVIMIQITPSNAIFDLKWKFYNN